MIVLDSDSVGLGDSFKRVLRFHCRFTIHFRHQVHVGEIRIVIDKDGGSNVSLSSGDTTVSWDKSASWTFQLVHAQLLRAWSLVANACAVLCV